MKIGKNIKPERSLNWVINFGSYRNETIKKIIDVNSAYISWLLSEKIIKLNGIAYKYFQDSLWDYTKNNDDLPF